jgi:hypothetical protein
MTTQTLASSALHLPPAGWTSCGGYHGQVELPMGLARAFSKWRQLIQQDEDSGSP